MGSSSQNRGDRRAPNRMKTSFGHCMTVTVKENKVIGFTRSRSEQTTGNVTPRLTDRHQRFVGTLLPSSGLQQHRHLPTTLHVLTTYWYWYICQLQLG